MKFQLFGRLRDDEDSDGGTPGQPQQQQQGPGLGNDAALGGGLENTVENMFSQGYSEEEIKQELQGQYPPEQVEQALNNAVANTATGGTGADGPEPMTPYQGERDAVSPVDEGFSNEGNDTMNKQPQQDMTEPGNPQATQQPQQQPQQSGQSRASGDVEELVETIVAENLDRVETEFENVYEEIDELRDHAEDLERRVHDLEVREEEDNQEFIQKVDEMEEHIDSYQSRIGGLEKAFQQVLPSLVDNVRDLTELVQEIKTERGIETDKNVSSDDIDDIDMEDWD
ncbi:MAG: hypothetical protein ABEJ07_01965 [Candidatus Nanohaloarchaea archaeon]